MQIDYPDSEQMKEIIRSKSFWENNPVFKPFYKRTGRVVIYSETHIDTLIGIDCAQSQFSLPTQKRHTVQLLHDLFNSTQLTQDSTMVYNEDDGIVNWTEVMKRMKDDCIKREEIFCDDWVVLMKVGTGERVQAVVTSTGQIDTECTEIILATKSWIMQLLEASFIQQPPASRMPIVIRIFSFSLVLNTEQ